jgi:hypothetical protein
MAELADKQPSRRVKMAVNNQLLFLLLAAAVIAAVLLLTSCQVPLR